MATKFFLAFISALAILNTGAEELDPKARQLGLVSPTCIAALIDDGASAFRSCTSLQTPFQIDETKDWTGRDVFTVTPVNGPEDGWLSYTTTEELWRYRLVEFVRNTGGTGQFSRIVGLPWQSDDYFYTKAGDRCNDGNHKILSAAGGELIYLRSATPFRILNFRDDTDWRSLRAALSLKTLTYEDEKSRSEWLTRLKVPRPLNDLAPYDEINNAAQSCVGYIAVSESRDKIEWGILLTKEYRKIDWANDERIEQCIRETMFAVVEKSGLSSPSSDYILLEADDLQGALDRSNCPKGQLENWYFPSE